MAILSREHGYLFIMSPRTGCTSIGEHVLIPHLDGNYFPPEDVTDDEGNVVVPRKHTRLGQLVDHGLLSKDETRGLFTFCGVRNPFDSLVSLYVKLTGQYVPLLDDPDSFVHKQPKMLEDLRFAAEHPFHEWVIFRFGPLLDEPARHLYQSYMNGVDRVIRFERLQDDFNEVCEELGLGHHHIPHTNRTEGRPSDYRAKYTTAARLVVERVFEPDITHLNYEF